MAAKTGIVEEGMAVGCGNVAEAFEGTPKTDLLVVAHYLYVPSSRAILVMVCLFRPVRSAISW